MANSIQKRRQDKAESKKGKATQRVSSKADLGSFYSLSWDLIEGHELEFANLDTNVERARKRN